MLNRPWVIAHRGACGYLPEHTLAAKALAHVQGADFLEQDVIATRDGRLIVCHDLFLDRITNVAEVFPGRSRADGLHYVIDFDWSEVRELAVRDLPGDAALSGVRGLLLASDPYERICLFEEEIDFIDRINRQTGRAAGIYPEIKNPGWHADHGFDLTKAVVRLLADRGFESADDAAFMQCFDADALRRVKCELDSSLRLVQLVGRSVDPARLTRLGLSETAGYASALAPNYRQLLQPEGTGGAKASELAHSVREAGLELHAYTFNLEGLPSFARDLGDLLEVFYEHVVPDAVICDFPDIAVRVRDRAAATS